MTEAAARAPAGAGQQQDRRSSVELHPVHGDQGLVALLWCWCKFTLLRLAVRIRCRERCALLQHHLVNTTPLYDMITLET
jgi:hypothetical protein